MTWVYLAIAAVVAFGFGFLIGERRAVKEANAILDANMKELFKSIGDAGAVPVDAEDGATRPSLH